MKRGASELAPCLFFEIDLETAAVAFAAAYAEKSYENKYENTSKRNGCACDKGNMN